MNEIRPKHVAGGLVIFGLGLFLTLLNSLYVVEFTKGLAQPIFLLIGLTSLAAALFNTPKALRKINLGVGVVFTAIGCYGVYDEYYATMDFLRGILPLLLIGGGVVVLLHGLTQVR